MHLVFVTSLVPSGPPESGYEIANACVIDALRRAGVRLTVLGFAWPGASPLDPQATVLLGEVDVRTDTASRVQQVAWLASAVWNGLTFASAKLRVIGEDTLRTRLAAIGEVDGYVLNGVPLAGAWPGLFMERPFFFIAHNVEHLSAQQNAQNARSTFQRLLYQREACILESLEAEFCARAHHVWTFAEEDIEALGLSRADASVLPLLTPQKPGAPRTGADIVFDAGLIGTWTWAPNRVGLEWFLREVAPRLPADARIAVAGKLPGDFDIRPPGVEFLGRVESADAFLRSCAVVPLVSRAGTGIQLKTIEAFQAGYPAVTTSSSLRGIGAVPANVTVADDPAAFAGALTEAIAKSRKNGPQDVDGRAFNESQRAGIDKALARDLAKLAQRPAQRLHVSKTPALAG